MESFDHRNKLAAPLRVLIGPVRSWVVVAIVLAISALVLAHDPTPTSDTSSNSNLPASAESLRASARLASLPGSDTAPAIVVLSRTSSGSSADLTATAATLRTTLAKELDTTVSPAIASRDGSVLLISVPVKYDLTNAQNASVVKKIRSIARDAVPSGAKAQVTGAPAVLADLSAVFKGANTKLLIATSLVVALLLLVTYRSPWLWLVPLAVVGVGDRVAAVAVDAVSAHWNIAIDGSTTGITSVLVFGAGTNYALLIIARYREELRHHRDRHEAMRRAIGAAAPTIASSSGTVVLALVALTLADAPFVSRIGLAGSVGIVIAVAFALIVLPSAMVLPGRWLFWPFIPHEGSEDSTHRGWWYRLGVAVTRRPWPVLTVGLIALVLMAFGSLGIRTGLGQDQEFLKTPESIAAQTTLQKAFPAGTSNPTTIATTPGKLRSVISLATQVDGVESATPSGSSSSVAGVRVVLSATPASDRAVDTIRALRDKLDGTGALVGGPDAQTLDERDTASSDRQLLIPLVLAVVVVMLLVLLRSAVAAALLISTTVLSYLAALGVGWLLFDHVFGWTAMDVSTPLLAFIFLVALGVDYNIFLTARAREEMGRTRDATASIVTALAVTGGVITSAGILLAAVFAVLGVLPLVLLAQLGVIVGFGVLLDTTIVRSVLTPALVALTGRRFWWPSRLSR